MENIKCLFHFSGKEKITPALLAVSDSGYAIKSLDTRVSHPCWVLDYVFSEMGKYGIGTTGTWKPRRAFTAHLYPPHTLYRESMQSSEKPGRSLWITFSKGDAAGLGALTGQGSFAEFEDSEKILSEPLQQIAKAGLKGDFWKAQSFFCLVISLLLNSRSLGKHLYSIETKSSAVEPTPFCKTVTEYLTAHLGERIRLGDLARHVRVSVSLLCHRYRKESGEAPMETLMALRMDRVKALLLKGERLKVIAEATGFTDEFHLSKMFKRKEGVSPRNYIRKLSVG